jgi:hypothetical protein
MKFEVSSFRRKPESSLIIEVSVNHDSDLLPFGLSPSTSLRRALSKPCAHSDKPFDKALLSEVEGLRANGSFVMLNGKLNNWTPAFAGVTEINFIVPDQ